jgi:hypothetical protein
MIRTSQLGWSGWSRLQGSDEALQAERHRLGRIDARRAASGFGEHHEENSVTPLSHSKDRR